MQLRTRYSALRGRRHHGCSHPDRIKLWSNICAEHPLLTRFSTPCGGAERDTLAKDVADDGFLDETVCGNAAVSTMFPVGAAVDAEACALHSSFEW